METHRLKHQIPELRRRDIPPHRLPVRPSELLRSGLRRSELQRASREAEKQRRKAQKEERKQAEMAIALVSVAILDEIVKAITKPNEPVQSPSKEPDRNIIPDSDITDAEFRDIVDDGDTKL